MAGFDIKTFTSQIKEEYIKETVDADVLHQNQKEFNEQAPKEWLERMQLKNLIENADGLLSGNLVGSDGDGGHNFSGNSNIEIVWSFFTDKGFSKEATAGILGNIGAETGGTYDPKTVQSGGKGPGTGLIQWEDGYSGRWNTLEKWATKEGKDKWQTETQIEFLWKEMNESYHLNLFSKNLKKYGYSPGSNPLDAYKKVKKIEDSVYIFELTIERAGVKNYSGRINYAKDCYNQLKNFSGGAAGGSGKLNNPAEGIITSPYGMRTHPVKKTQSMHKGIDIAGGGTNILAAANGKVVIAKNGYNGGFGNYIKIEHGSIGGTKIDTLYAHLAKIEVSVGDTVNQGKKIGVMGTTGMSTGVHLHFEVHENGSHTDPQKYVKY